MAGKQPGDSPLEAFLEEGQLPQPPVSRPWGVAQRLTVRALAVLLLVLFPGRAHAQVGEIRIAEATSAYHPSVPLDSGGEIGLYDSRFSVNLPVELVPDRSYLLPGLSYQFMQIRSSGAETPGPDRLHLLRFDALLMHRFSPRWTGVFETNYGLASDFAGRLSSKDAFMSGTGIVLFEVQPGLRFGAGMAYDSRTGEMRPLPLAAISWQPTPRFALKGVVPANVNLQLRVAESTTLLLNARLDGQQYRIHDDAGRDVQLAYSTVKIGAGARFHISEHLHCMGLVGVLTRRRLEAFIDDRPVDNGSLPPGPFVSFELWLGDGGWEVR